MKREISPLILTGDITNKMITSPEGRQQIDQLKKLIDFFKKYPNGNLQILAGDRDWNNSGKGGQKNALTLEKEIETHIKETNTDNVKWTLEKGCPGPEVIELDEHLIMVAINSQWFNHPFDKPRPADAVCDIITLRDFMEELDDVIEENLEKNILIVAHHPIFSLGNYGGYFSLGDQMRPFPLVGSFRTAFKANVGTSEDISNERLQTYEAGLTSMLYTKDNLIFATGHEKNQQLILRNNNYLVNSGAPSKGGFATSNFETVFNSKKAGLVQLEYLNDGDVKSHFYEYQSGKFEKQSSQLLMHSVCHEENYKDDIPHNLSFVPCDLKASPTEQMQEAYNGGVLLAAGPEYQASGWKKLWLGQHYRTTWTTPIQTQFLNLDTTLGGLQILKKGGGRQTTSLRFRAGSGAQYTFRSVNKDPTKALHYEFRETFISNIARDQTSSQNPYGALAVSSLLDHIDILHARPRLFVLPDDLKLGSFRWDYGNLFGMLEEAPGKKDNKGQRFAGAKKIVRSNELFRLLYKNNKTEVDYKRFVRARLFDILIGDWSKHEDNWKWAGFEQDGKMVYQPIPRDRDHAFSKLDGILPWIADREWGIPNTESFRPQIKGLQSLVFQARHMDRLLTQKAVRADFIEQAKYIQERIGESEIELAIAQFPLETFDQSGSEIMTKLKQRIKDLDQYAEAYYQLLAKEIDLVGTNDEEYFDLKRENDGSIQVRIYQSDNGRKGKLKFERTFLAGETKEIRLFGLGDDDVFDLKGAKNEAIQIRLLGGSGDDLYQTESSEALVYDKGKGTKLELGKESKVINHWDKDIYEYDRTAYQFNSYLPILVLGYNTFDGATIRGGLSFTNHKYGKEDYSSKHTIMAGLSSQLNKLFSYKARFHHVFRKWDLQFQAGLANPEFYNNFYGIGNSTLIDADLDAMDFYEAEYNRYYTSLGLVKDFWRYSQLGVSIGVEHNQAKRLDGTILAQEEQEVIGANSSLNILPFNIFLNLDFRDSRALPTRGTRLLLNYHNGTVLSEEADNYGVLSGALEYYTSSRTKNPITLGLRAGGAVGYGDVPFYKQMALGSTSGLRGYTRNRFLGESSLFFNSELRLQLFEKYTSFIPIKFGLKAFYDLGRVYSDFDGDNDPGFHSGYGFGVYLIPLRETFTISVSLSFSEEESLFPLISVGTPLQ